MKKIQAILSHLHEILTSVEFKERHRFNAHDFVRNRSLGFTILVASQLMIFSCSLSVVLCGLLEKWGIEGTYTKQAFSKARKKLNWSAFIELNRVFLQDYSSAFSPDLYMDKYRLLAVDGSLCQLPDCEVLKDEFGTSNNQHGQGMAMGRASVLYDVLNEHVLDGQFAPLSRGESSLLEDHLTNLDQHLNFITDPCLFLMDRNYPSFKLMHQLQKAGHFFVIRCKANHCKEVSSFAKDKSCNDKELVIKLNSQRCPGWKDFPSQIKVRIVRILLPSGQEEYLLTNTDFEPAILGQLYYLRWGVESFYGRFKSSMELENFTAKLPTGIQQDFHAKVLLHNLSQMFIRPAQEKIDQEQQQQQQQQQQQEQQEQEQQEQQQEQEQQEQEQEKKELKYPSKVNQHVAIGILRDKLAKMLETGKISQKGLSNLVDTIKKHKTPIRPDRNPPRKKAKKTRRKYHITKRRTL